MLIRLSHPFFVEWDANNPGHIDVMETACCKNLLEWIDFKYLKGIALHTFMVSFLSSSGRRAAFDAARNTALCTFPPLMLWRASCSKSTLAASGVSSGISSCVCVCCVCVCGKNGSLVLRQYGKRVVWCQPFAQTTPWSHGISLLLPVS